MSDFWQETIRAAETLRHELHQHPELGWQEWQTAQRIRTLLSAWHIPWRTAATTGTVAILNQAAQGRAPHTALRADMDALPITEQTSIAYQSKVAGCMHACGHDGHTATLLAAARWLKQHEAALPGPVTLLFQPAEEGGHGAAQMIADGALDGVDQIFGWHNWPALPFGHLLCPDGLVMCGNGVFDIQLSGRGGHASEPHLCNDPVLAGAAIVLNLKQVVATHLPATSPAVVAVTSMLAPSGATVVPQTAKLAGSIRISDDATRATLTQAITEVVTATASIYGVHCEVTHETRYGATINHAEPAARVRALWQQFGLHQSELSVAAATAKPVMASEDFSYYLREIPGAFCLVGANDGAAHSHTCHSPHFDFNDRLLPLVTRLFAALCGAPYPP